MTNTTKHMPGPWTTSGAAIRDPSNFPLACCITPGQGYSVALRNAARIVACVNACEGYDNDVLSRNPLREVWLDRSRIANDCEALRDKTAALCAERDTLKAQRDELAAALRDAVNVLHRLEYHMPRYNGLRCPPSLMVPPAAHDYGWNLSNDRDNALKAACAALAKVGGGK